MRRPIPIKPGPGEESVWDYPRPPRLEHVGNPVQIVFGGKLIVDADECFRVLETSHPPVYYVSAQYIAKGVLKPVSGASQCEWKGLANYFDVQANGKFAPRAAWRYAAPMDGFAPIAGFVAFYAGPMEQCSVGGQIVTPQPGNFYGGWITPGIVGPFKGETGSQGWSTRLWVAQRKEHGMARPIKKQDLPVKACLTCNRPLFWRKKWAKVWDEVKYCSDAWRAQRRATMG